MSGPETAEDTYMSAESILDSIFPKIDFHGAPPTEEELKEYPEILPPEMKQEAGMSESRKTTRRNSKPGGDIVSQLLLMRNQIKLYHWQTRSFADHKATDDLTTALDQKIDMFVEVFMGKYGRPVVSGTIKLHNFTGDAARDFVERQTLYLLTILPKKLKKTDTDLLNIRDEILAELNKIRYLFTLH
jgi:Family of unknown function (DUF5856)